MAVTLQPCKFAGEEGREFRHAADPGKEGRNGNRDHDCIHVLHHHVQVVVDDGSTGFQQAAEHLVINLRLIQELLVFDHQVVQLFEVLVFDVEHAGPAGMAIANSVKAQPLAMRALE